MGVRLRFGGLQAAIAALSAGLLAVGSQRYRRRIGDDGDLWRSLLLGAPPAFP